MSRRRMSTRCCRRDLRCGFTLVELLVAVAIAVILLAALNSIFITAAQTAGSGQAITTIVRDLRGVKTQMEQDLSAAAIFDGPCLVIRNQRQDAFRNAGDEKSDIDASTNPTTYKRTIDLNADNTEGVGGAEVIPTTACNYRSHRLDRMGFFVRGSFSRQTGNDGVFVAPMNSNEAFVWYGHLKLPNNVGQWYIDPPTNSIPTNPGAGTAATNPNNFYASQWVLGRVATLLVTPASSPLPSYLPTVRRDQGAWVITDTYTIGDLVTGLDGNPYICIKDASAGLDPTLSANQSYWLPPQSYFGITNPVTAPLYGNANSTKDGINPEATPFITQSCRFDLAGGSIREFREYIRNLATGTDWWSPLMLDDTTTNGRYQGNPSPTKPLDPTKAAQLVPCFLRGCSQFIVEYAGDFLTQGDTGLASGNAPDGQIDFVIPTTGPNQGRRVMRWYGLPRNIDDNGVIVGTGADNNAMPDVVPLRDVIRTIAGLSASSGMSFERFSTNFPTPLANYAATTGGMLPDATYTCAWGPYDIKPSMLRIIIVVEDPNGRLSEGRTMEFIFNLTPDR